MFRAAVPAATVINRLSNCWSGHKHRIFWSEIGLLGSGKWAAHPHPTLLGVFPGHSINWNYDWLIPLRGYPSTTEYKLE